MPVNIAANRPHIMIQWLTRWQSALVSRLVESWRLTTAIYPSSLLAPFWLIQLGA